MTLTKRAISQTLRDRAGHSRNKSQLLVEAVFELIKKSLQSQTALGF